MERNVSIDELLESELGQASLLDRWVSGDLEPDEHLEVTAAILSDPALRTEAALRLAVSRGIEANAAPVPSAFTVALRRVGGAIKLLADSLAPLPAPAVAVRNGAQGEAASRSFDLGAIAPGAVLHVAAEGMRYRLMLDPSGGDRDWILEGQDLRRVVSSSVEDGADLGRVDPGTWTLSPLGGPDVRLRLLDEN